MKKSFIISISLIIFISLCLLLGYIILQQQREIEKEEAIPPGKLKEDLDFLVKSIEEIHPNPYANISKEEFYELKDGVEKKLDKPMTQVEFYKLIAPLVASLEDGHTRVNLPEINDENLFPLKV